MKNNLARLKRLAGIFESNFDEFEDDDDDGWYERGIKIKKLIAIAFKKIGISLADEEESPIVYDEQDNRMAYVTVENNEIDVDLLAGLKRTGLADKFKIYAEGDFSLCISFSVHPSLDNTVS